jgi:UDP-N-acetylmuramoyl-L-alanyl-D-glutamate--2,6-diaminopimelate ligase
MATSMRTTRELSKRFSLEFFGADHVEVSAVAMNSKHVIPGSLFIAAQGANSHGLDHLEAAIAAGAVAVLSDRQEQLAVPNLYHPNPRVIAGSVSEAVFETSNSNMLLYAVTGTNGKTSTVFYLRELLNALGQSAGLISSAFSKVGASTYEAELTTPEAPRIHQLLQLMRLEGQASAAIEASAQGLTRARLQGLHFRIAGFTNLSRDHLDDYSDMSSYLDAKAKLFTAEFADRAVVFLSDDFARELFSRIEIPKVAIGQDYHFSYENSMLKISGKANLSAEIELPTLMARNLGLALVMLMEDSYSVEKLERALEHINTSVPGRLERVSDSKPAVFVDYAHTPDAVGSATEELAARFEELTVVLAASGDRDAGKRPEMAKAARRHADRIIVTDQHPRSEDPSVIRAQVIAGLDGFSNYEEIADPTEAIRQAIKLTSAGGAVLWCGPGHLKYREVKGQKLPFDAVEIARQELGDD